MLWLTWPQVYERRQLITTKQAEAQQLMFWDLIKIEARTILQKRVISRLSQARYWSQPIFEPDYFSSSKSIKTSSNPVPGDMIDSGTRETKVSTTVAVRCSIF